MPTSESQEREWIGRNIAAERHRRHLTQEQLGDRIGVSQGMISGWETGRTKVPTHMVARLAEALGVDESRFFRRD